jgi:hypothetical protein
MKQRPPEASTTESAPSLARPSLRELQTAFAAAVYEDRTSIVGHLCDGAFEAARHARIYRNNAYANLTEALAAVYPVVQRLVGADFFEQTARRYIAAHSPRSGNLHDFGAAFADFLRAFDAAQSLPYLPDVARLEWAWHEAFHAADAPPFDFARLATVPAAEYGALMFALHPSTRLLESRYPILRIWQVNQPDHVGEPTVDLHEGGDYLVVWLFGLGG